MRGTPDGSRSHPLYWKWREMIKRCRDKNHHKYKHYGGRGIYVCSEWKDFWTWLQDVGQPPGPSYSMDRINNDGPYKKSNFRWATKSEQSKNRRPYSDWKVKKRTSCYGGHSWTDKNTMLTHNGKRPTRRCKICLKKRLSK